MKTHGKPELSCSNVRITQENTGEENTKGTNPSCMRISEM